MDLTYVFTDLSFFHLVFPVFAGAAIWSFATGKNPSATAFFPLSGFLFYLLYLTSGDNSFKFLLPMLAIFLIIILAAGSFKTSGYLTLLLIVLSGKIFGSMEMVIPAGFSFLLMRFHDSIDHFKKEQKFSLNQVRLLLLQTFHLPALLAGPVITADKMIILDKNKLAHHRLMSGALTALGMVKIFLFIPFLQINFETGLLLPLEVKLSTVTNLLHNGLYNYLRLYLDFSGYTDLAVGLAGLAGVIIPHNFNRPWLALSLQDFWNRWNITLIYWIKKHMLNTDKSPLLLLLVVAVWHGLTLPFILWGLAHGLFMILESKILIPRNQHHRFITAIRYTFTQVFIILTFNLFFWKP